MQLKHPVIITPRLLPGIKIGNSWISLDPTDDSYYLDLETENGKHIEYEGNDLRRGMGQDTQSTLSALLSFMSACGESFAYGMRTTGNPRDGENTDLFPLSVAAWCYQNENELSMLSIELEETENAIDE